MLYKLFVFFHRFNKTAHLMRWCKGKTPLQINRKFGEKVGVTYCLDESRQAIEILLKKGTLTCVISNSICKYTYFFPDAEYPTSFPGNIFEELKHRKHSTGKEQINPDLFTDYDINTFTWQDWANLHHILVQRYVSTEV